MIFLMAFFLLASASCVQAETVERIEFSYADFFKVLEQEATRLLLLQYGESSGFSVEIQPSQRAYNLEAVSELVHDGIADVLFLRGGTQPSKSVEARPSSLQQLTYRSRERAAGLRNLL